MNETKSAAELKTGGVSRRWFQRWRTWVAVAVLAFVVWFLVPASYSAGGIRFTVYGQGPSGALTFVVRGAHGQPMPGVSVMSESSSGTTPEFLTDAAGRAVIRPGESEVLAVFIQDQKFLLSPFGSWETFAPSCFGGLTFEVMIRK